jgi:glycosyltransferase involved in cell wall biosynthesis
MTNTPLLITIIIAVYNNVQLLQRCIDSVTNQSYSHTELVIIDGGSTDGTVQLIEHNQDKITYWESQKDRGIYHAWNKGLVHTKGEWVIFLGSDDYFFSPQTLELVSASLKSCSPETTVVYGKVKVFRSDGKEVDNLGDRWCRQDFLQQGNTLPHTGMFHRRTLFEKYGNFDESFKIAGDYELLIRVLKNSDPIFLEDVTVAFMQNGGTSDTNPLKTVLEFIKAIKNNNLSPYSFKMAWSLTRVLLKLGVHKVTGDRGAKKLIDMYRILTGRSARWDA